MLLGKDNPMMRVLLMTLYCEVVVFGLSLAVMIMVDGVRPAVAGALGGLAALLALVAGVLLKRGAYGQVLGWLTQVVGVALGIASPIMFVVGGVFAGIYLAMFILGRRIETGRTA